MNQGSLGNITQPLTGNQITLNRTEIAALFNEVNQLLEELNQDYGEILEEI